MSEDRKLVKKLAEIQSLVRYIQKTGKNAAQGYKYVTEADVVDKIAEELAKRHLAIIPSMKSLSFREFSLKNGGSQTVATLVMTYTIEDGETGETRSYDIPGEGADSGDKQVYKAMTGSHKYSLMKLFKLETGDDPEQDEKPEPVAKPAAKAPPLAAKAAANTDKPKASAAEAVRAELAALEKAFDKDQWLKTKAVALKLSEAEKDDDLRGLYIRVMKLSNNQKAA